VDETARAPESKPAPGRSAIGHKARVGTARIAANLAIGIALAAGGADCGAQSGRLARSKVAQEIAPFRLTGIDGYMVTRYLSDESNTSGSAGGAGSRARQSNLSEEIFLMSHSYIYHPSLLSLDLGGGPVIDKGRFDSDGVTTNSRRQMFNFSGRATVLRDKPYNGALFYDHRNQTQTIGPAQVMLTENTRYGFNFSLRNPVTPIPMQMEITRSENQGTGADQVIDDRIDQVRIRMETGIGRLGRSAFQYLGTRQDSVSGSSGLPIQASRSSNDGVNVDTRLKFGAKNEYDLTNVVTLNTNRYTAGQGTLAEVKDYRFGLDLRGRHTEDLQTYGRYDLGVGKQGEQEMTLNSLGAGVNYRFNPQLYGTLAARGENNKTTHLDSTLYGIDASAQYRRALPLGEATAGYSVAYNQRDQQAGAQQTRLIGEHVTLTGTTLATLANEQIVAGSVIVSNLTRSQIFVEGRDYVLSAIGLRLRVQRLIGGNILDGQEVLIDYAFATGGTYAASQFDNTVNFSWALKNYLNLFMRYLDSAPHLESGTPTSPLNPVKSMLYGSRAELPLSLLSQDFLLGGRAEREIRRETISPYKSSNLEAFVQMELPWVKSGNVRLGSRHLQVDYDLSPTQGVKLVAYDLRLWARAGYGIDLSADTTRERDTGAPEVRERALTSAKAQWRRRKLSLTFDLTRVRDAQGASERKRTYAQVLLRRDF